MKKILLLNTKITAFLLIPLYLIASPNLNMEYQDYSITVEQTGCDRLHFRKTVNDEVYVKNCNFPKLGSAWEHIKKGYNRLNLDIWTDLARDEKGQVLYVTHNEAREYCKKLDAKIPDESSYRVLAHHLGVEYHFLNQHNPTDYTNYSPFEKGCSNADKPEQRDSCKEILPGLSKHHSWANYYAMTYSPYGQRLTSQEWLFADGKVLDWGKVMRALQREYFDPQSMISSIRCTYNVSNRDS